MKSVQQKYEEAKQRALNGIEKYVRELQVDTPRFEEWTKSTVKEIKTRLGIRSADMAHDELLLSLKMEVIARAVKAGKKFKEGLKETGKALTEPSQDSSPSAFSAPSAPAKASKTAKV